jgi:hypothetical protein
VIEYHYNLTSLTKQPSVATTTTLTVPSISAPPTIFSSISVAPQASSSSPRLDTTPTSTKGPSMSVMPFPAKQNQRGLIAGASIGAITLAVLIGLGAFLLYRSFKRRRASIEDEEDGFEKGDEAKGCPAMDIPNMNPPSDKAAKVLGMVGKISTSANTPANKSPITVH